MTSSSLTIPILRPALNSWHLLPWVKLRSFHLIFFFFTCKLSDFSLYLINIIFIDYVSHFSSYHFWNNSLFRVYLLLQSSSKFQSALPTAHYLSKANNRLTSWQINYSGEPIYINLFSISCKQTTCDWVIHNEKMFNWITVPQAI